MLKVIVPCFEMQDNEVCAFYFISISICLPLLLVLFVHMNLRAGGEVSRLHEWVSSFQSCCAQHEHLDSTFLMMLET